MHFGERECRGQFRPAVAELPGIGHDLAYGRHGALGRGAGCCGGAGGAEHAAVAGGLGGHAGVLTPQRHIPADDARVGRVLRQRSAAQDGGSVTGIDAEHVGAGVAARVGDGDLEALTVAHVGQGQPGGDHLSRANVGGRIDHRVIIPPGVHQETGSAEAQEGVTGGGSRGLVTKPRDIKLALRRGHVGAQGYEVWVAGAVVGHGPEAQLDVILEPLDAHHRNHRATNGRAVVELETVGLVGVGGGRLNVEQPVVGLPEVNVAAVAQAAVEQVKEPALGSVLGVAVICQDDVAGRDAIGGPPTLLRTRVRAGRVGFDSGVGAGRVALEGHGHAGIGGQFATPLARAGRTAGHLAQNDYQD